MFKIKDLQAFATERAKKGDGPAEIRMKAVAMIGDQKITDEEGNEVEFESISLVPKAKAEEEPVEEEEAKMEGEEEAEETEKRLVTAITKNIAAKLDADRKAAEAVAKKKAKTVAGGDIKAEDDDAENKAFTVWATARRSGALKNFRGTRENMSADDRAKRFGAFFLDRVSKALPSFAYAFPRATKFCELNGLSLQHVQGGIVHKASVHQTAANALGGYLVPDEFVPDVIDLREERGVLRRLARIHRMTSDHSVIPRRTGGLTAYYTSEGSPTITESNKSWDDVTLTAKTVSVLTRYSRELNEDAVINIGDDLAGEIAYAFADREDTDGFNGTGVAANGGIQGLRNRLTNLDGSGTDSAGLVQPSSDETWSLLALTDFQEMVGLLPQYADTPSTVWVCHRAFYYGVMQRLELAAGGTTALEIREGNRKPRPLFLGYPVEMSQVFPSVTAVSQVAALLGDFTQACTLGDRSGIAIDISEHATVGGENVFERNQIAIRGMERWDFNAHDVGDANNAGPVVGIETAAS